MKHKRSKSSRRREQEPPPLPFLVSKGFEDDCPMCRAMEENADLFGDPMEVSGAEVREILDMERWREITGQMERGPWSWSVWDDED